MRRKPGAERRAEIAAVAGDLFASEGFQVSTRAISARLGITQAALYKHFKSKDELIEEVFRQRFLHDRESAFAELLSAPGLPLAERLSQAYIDFLHQITSTSLRLFQRASYDGLALAKRYSPHLDSRILWPVIDSLRSELSLPGVATIAPLDTERDLALMLHSTVVFLAIRQYVYHIDFKGGEDALVTLHVDTWLPGALARMTALHA